MVEQRWGVFDPANVSPELSLEYPTWKIDAKDQKVGYFIIIVNETAGTWTGIQKVYDSETGKWATGDNFKLIL